MSIYPYFRDRRSSVGAKSIAFVGEVAAGRVAFFGRVLEEAMRVISERGDEIEARYLIMSNDDLPHRDRVVEALASQGMRCTVVDLRALPVAEVIQTFRGVSAMVTARFHGLVLSLIAGTPALSVDLSFGKQSILIKDYFPSMNGSVIDEASSSDANLAKLRALVTDPLSFVPDSAGVEALGSAMRLYAHKLAGWVAGGKETQAAGERGSQAEDSAQEAGVDKPRDRTSTTLLADPGTPSANDANSEFNLERARVLLQITQEIVRNAATEPTLELIGSQLCTASQFRSQIYLKWCEELREAPRLHRKQWEFVYILQGLASAGKLGAQSRGLGFGCGREPLPAVMVARGCSVVATDLDLASAVERGWTSSAEHAGSIEDLYRPGISAESRFCKMSNTA